MTASISFTAGKNRAFTLIELLVVIAIIAILAAILFPVFAQAREKARQTACLSNLKQMSLACIAYAQDYDEMMPQFWYVDTAPPKKGTLSWITVIQPYAKSGALRLCPSFDNKGWSVAGSSWISPNNAFIEDGYFKTSYGLNGLQDWGSSNYKDADGTVWAPADHHGPGSYNNGGSMTTIARPANTVLLVENFAPDVWKWVFTDMPKVAGSGNKSYIGNTTGEQNLKTAPYTPDKIHSGMTNVAWSDGHASAHKWGAIKPADFTVQDDKDPVGLP
jgi:prepilin-type N-terminal cleavage/methylation domain-containing protein/prepilin-type processing-associated H-X9-DG protein